MLTDEQLTEIERCAQRSLDTHALYQSGLARHISWPQVEEAKADFHAALPEETAIALISQARLAPQCDPEHEITRLRARVAELEAEIQSWRRVTENVTKERDQWKLHFEIASDNLGAITEAERDEALAQVAALREALMQYVDWFGAAHCPGCSEDPCCDCERKPLNDAVNAAIASTSPTAEAFLRGVRNKVREECADAVLHQVGELDPDGTPLLLWHADIIVRAILAQREGEGKDNED